MVISYNFGRSIAYNFMEDSNIDNFSLKQLYKKTIIGTNGSK